LTVISPQKSSPFFIAKLPSHFIPKHKPENEKQKNEKKAGRVENIENKSLPVSLSLSFINSLQTMTVINHVPHHSSRG
jgi:hypothetical protein